MSKEMSLILAGVFVIVVPYLGIPSSWKTPLLVLSGLAILLLGLLLRGESLSRQSGAHRNESRPFVESSEPQVPEQPDRIVDVENKLM